MEKNESPLQLMNENEIPNYRSKNMHGAFLVAQTKQDICTRRYMYTYEFAASARESERVD